MIKRILTAAVIILSAFPLTAGPFVDITGIDARTDFPAVKIMVTVLGPDHRGITGLDEGNLLVYEDGYRVNYVRVKDVSAADEYLYLVFAVDSSKSISKDFLGKIKSSAGKIAESASARDRIAVYRFNDKVEMLNSFTSNRAQIAKSIKSVERDGSRTLLYDGIYDSLELLGRVEKGRRAVIVFTDGKDEGSSVSSEDIVKRAREYAVPVYFLTVKGVKNSSTLARLAKLTGGRLVYSRNSDVAGIYSMVRSCIKNSYEINYRSIVKRDNSKHNVEVRLKYGDISDSDSGIFTAERNFLKFGFPDYIYILFAGLILVLLILLVCLCAVFMKRGGKRVAEAVNGRPDEKNASFRSGLADLIEEDELFCDEYPSDIPEKMYEKAWLMKKEGNRAAGKIVLQNGEITIGTAPESTIAAEDPFMSELHSRIKRMGGGYYLYDLISESGTYLNGKKILRPRLLHDWDEIRMGNSVFIFRGTKL